MIHPTVRFTTCLLLTAWSLNTAAEPAKKLGDVCPRLQIPTEEQQSGDPEQPIVIDNAMVDRLADKGRFAAIGPATTNDVSSSAAAETLQENRNPRKSRDQWRAAHRREVAAIRKLALRLAISREELQGLQDQYFRANSEVQRMRMEPRLNRKKLEIRDLEYSLQKQRASFSRLIHEARLDGAQPGWFRDLPRP